MVIAALFVAPKGCYVDLDGVDPWDEQRDARLYAGPHPVIAHPPCARWCRLAGLVEARWGHKRGEDGGCFESALASVRQWGGVLEHPAYSDAFKRYGIPSPEYGGWHATICGGWVAYVEQARYGHLARKATWLYVVGTDGPPPPLRWGYTLESGADRDCPRQTYQKRAQALVSWCGNNINSGEIRPRLSSKAAKATPLEFRDQLIEIAMAIGADILGES